jgi:hypothetical protein
MSDRLPLNGEQSPTYAAREGRRSTALTPEGNRSATADERSLRVSRRHSPLRVGFAGTAFVAG